MTTTDLSWINARYSDHDGAVPERVDRVASEERLEHVPLMRVLPDRELWGRVEHAGTTQSDIVVKPGTLAQVADLVDAARSALVDLWRDYAEARRAAHNGVWSGGCESVAARIARLTLLLGPCRWEDVEEGPLRDGSYRALHAALGMDPGIDEEKLAGFLARGAADRERMGVPVP